MTITDGCRVFFFFFFVSLSARRPEGKPAKVEKKKKKEIEKSAKPRTNNQQCTVQKRKKKNTWTINEYDLPRRTYTPVPTTAPNGHIGLVWYNAVRVLVKR